jgi:phage N-6-adenine-methyltransferase
LSEPYISSSEKWDWVTPPEWIDFLDDLFNLTLDVAAEDWNTQCESYITPAMDSLRPEVEWKTSGRWFLNPPWGREYKKVTGKTIEDWIIKATIEYMHGKEGVMFAPMNCSTGWWHKHVKRCPYIFFPDGRIKFLDPERSKPSQPTKGTSIWLYIQQLTKEQIDALMEKGWLVSSNFFVPPDILLVHERPRGKFKGFGIG